MAGLVETYPKSRWADDAEYICTSFAVGRVRVISTMGGPMRRPWDEAIIEYLGGAELRDAYWPCFLWAVISSIQITLPSSLGLP